MAESINIRVYDLLLKYYLHIPKPSELTDEEWAENIQDLHYVRTQEKQASEQ